MNSMQGVFLKALELYERSRGMFEQMGNTRMVAFSLKRKAQISARLCKAADAGKAYQKASELMEKLEGKEKNAVHFRQQGMQNISELCEVEPLWGQFAFYVLTIIIFLFVLCFLYQVCYVETSRRHRCWIEKRQAS